MHRLLLLAIFAMLSMNAAEPSEEKAVIATVQKVFDAMAAHDPEAVQALLIPEGRLVAMRDGAKLTNISHEQFIEHLRSTKQVLLERMWNPKVLLHGAIAVVWADYDFHLDGKFTHCGVDVFNLLKTSDGWKIASITYTAETTGCPDSPLGSISPAAPAK